MPALRRIVFLALLALASAVRAQLPGGPPEPPREFRAAWIASVGNMDWPSRPSLTANDQKAEFRAILDRAVQLRLNALILQVRPACDALYESALEPWSHCLTGTMGKTPGYDPLAFCLAEAHTRGLELHAWFNPFRALTVATAPTSTNHVSKQHPEWVRRYGNQLWLDPGEPAAREHTLAVIGDVVRRYDIDGVHLDDYFYPYPTARKAPFPDDETFARYTAQGGQLSRDDWRRENNNELVRQIYRRVKEAKPWVKVGISPFGIWRPGVPDAAITGLDAYAEIFADTRRWLQEGWCDYFSPQLYWSIAPRRQSFPVLLQWWSEQNARSRHLWPGIATERIGPARPAAEILNQIALARSLPGASGHLHWNNKALMINKGKIGDLLRAQLYQQFALVPASPWLGASVPEKPIIETGSDRLTWRLPSGNAPRWWLVQAQRDDTWASQLIPGTRTSGQPPRTRFFAIRAVDFSGQLGQAAVIEMR